MDRPINQISLESAYWLKSLLFARLVVGTERLFRDVAASRANLSFLY